MISSVAPRSALSAACALSLVGCVLLAGCASKFEAMTPEIRAGMLTDLQAGKLNLDCGVKCDFTWAANAPTIHALDLAEKWDDLAVRVMQIGYGSDLAYYYLGQSAQGKGYHQAAIGYYGYALGLLNGPNPLLKCEGGQGGPLGGDPCQGVDLANSIPVLVQASRDAEAQQALADQAASQPAPVVHHRRHHTPAATSASASAPAASGPATSSGDTGWAVPPPPAQ